MAENTSAQTAKHVRDKLLEAIYSLGKMPTANPVARGIVSKNNITYRRVLSMSYRIVYAIDEPRLRVLVVEIHHTKRNPEMVNKGFE